LSLGLFSAKIISRQWTSSFLQRHKDTLRERKAKYPAGKRADSAVLTDVDDFISAVELAREKYKLAAHTCVNDDETRIVLGSGNETVIEWKGKERANSLGTAYSALATLLIFVAANGEVLMSVIITKGTSSQDGSKIKATFAVEEAIFGHNTRSKKGDTHSTLQPQRQASSTRSSSIT